MKYLILLAAFYACISTAPAQQTNDMEFLKKIETAGWLHRSDVLINNDKVRVDAREVYLDKQIQYCFTVSLNNKQQYFTILSQDFSKGDYVDELFIRQFTSTYNELLKASQNNHLEKDTLLFKIQKNIDSISGKGNLSEFDQTLLEELFDYYSKNYRDDVLESFYNIKSKINNEEDISWMQEQITTYKAQVKTRKEDSVKNIEKFTADYLDKIFDILAERKNEGPRVGMLYLNDTINAYWYKVNEKKIEMDTIFIHYKNDKRDTVVIIKEKNYKIKKKYLTIEGKKAKPKKDKIFIKNRYQDTIKFQIKEAELKFEYGQLAGITVKGCFDEYQDEVFTFHNRTPIPYSTKFDVSSDHHILGERRIYCINKKKDGFYIRLEDVLYNDYKMNNFTENYSPIDTVITLRPMEAGRVIFQERVADILQARVFSDFIGYDKNNPNGIIQLELSKRINLRSKPLGSTKKIYAWHLLRHITPLVAFTKVEENEKYFDVAIKADTLGAMRPIDFVRYNNFRAGAQLNIIGCNIPTLHSNLNYETSFQVMLTGISTSSEERDTVGSNFLVTQTTDQHNALSANIAPVILNWHIYPHSQYHISFAYKLQLISELDSQVKFENSRRNLSFIHQLGLFAGVKLNEAGSGEMFLRILLDMDVNDLDQNFIQGQLGYSFKILSGKPRIKSRSFFNQL